MIKGLEALNEIEKFVEKNLSKTKDNESFNLGFDIGIIEKDLKAFEIIKEKLVNLFIVAYTDTKEAYNDMVSEHYRELTQDEYELLKEIL